ncbi:MAG: hypothetical protein U9Q62_04035 [Campylobacterota bacterium]|nr:hypothetical protein [Campylobacterota bacterium]
MQIDELKEERDQLELRKIYWRKKVGNIYVPIMIVAGLVITVIHLFAGIAFLVGVIIFTRAIDEHIKSMQEDYIDILNEIREIENKM